MRRLLLLAAKIAVSAALLYLAFARVDISAIGGRLQQARFAWLVALALILFLQIVLVAMRWRQIVLQCGAPLSMSAALRYMLIASFFNQTLPSTVGGDAARIWFVARTGAGWRRATYSVLVDRVVGLTVLVAIVIICLPWLLQLVRDPIGRASVLLVNGAGLLGTLVFLILGRLRWPWLERWWLTREIAGAAAAAYKLMTDARPASIVVGLSVAIHLMTITAVWCAARAVAVPLEFGYALLLVPPVVLVSTIPISIAGWGVREGAMMAVFTYAGLLDADGLIVSVLYGLGLFAVGAAGGLLWILSAEQRMWSAAQRAPDA